MHTQELDLSSASKIHDNRGIDKAAVKIVELISRLCIGGTSVAVIRATEFLLNQGYPVHLLTGSVVGDEASIEDFASRRGVHFTKLQSLSRTISPWNDFKSVWQLIRLFRREQPTIVHTHTAKAGLLGRIAARVAGVPICVHTFHGHVFHGHFSPAKSRIYLEVEKLLARWTECLVAVSHSQGNELVEKYHLAPASKFVTIPVAFDFDSYAKPNGSRGLVRKQFNCSASSPLIGWVGRLAAVKDPELFVDAATLILKRVPNAKFAIAGDGELRGRLERLLTERGMASSTKLISWQRDLPSFYADIDILVMTSKHEGTPLTLLEAMASSKPFVSTDVGGIGDLMTGVPRHTDGIAIFKNGVLTEPSATHLAAGIEYLLDHREIGLQMGRAGRAFVSDRFANNRSEALLENLYLTLVEKANVKCTLIEPKLNKQ